MPWVRRDLKSCGPKGREIGLAALAACQAAWLEGFPLTQGIGLRPQPWAGFSRPVGPALLEALQGGFSTILRIAASRAALC